jgi:proline dehydrogenase
MDINNGFEKFFSGRWIAGAHIEDALEVAKKFNSKNITAIINYLGEAIRDKDKIEATVDRYLFIISKIKENNLNAEISLKPTQLGLGFDEKLLFDSYAKIVGEARRNNIFVWLDMEENNFVDDTIKLYYSQTNSKNTGICIQAYLKRSIIDVKDITKKDGIIRLVKGAYKESSDVAFQDMEEITKNYVELMRYLFENSKRFMIATHDLSIIELAKNLNKIYNRTIEYAMLNGIRNRYAVRLAKEGKNVYIYVPFGEQWTKYAYRRLREGGHALLILKSLFEKQSID